MVIEVINKAKISLLPSGSYQNREKSKRLTPFQQMEKEYQIDLKSAWFSQRCKDFAKTQGVLNVSSWLNG